MIVFLLGLSVFLQVSNAYVIHHNNAEEDQKSASMFINGQDNPEGRRHGTDQKRHRKRGSDDVLEELYNNAPDFEKRRQHGAGKRSKHHKEQLRSNDMDIANLVKGVFNYFSKSPVLHSSRSNLGGGEETKIDLVKLVNGAFSYLASLNPEYRANNMRAKHLEPRAIELRSKDDSSLLYEINTKRIVEDVTDLLSSQAMKGYVDTIARKAATIYKAVTKDD